MAVTRTTEVGGYVSLEVFDEGDANALPGGWLGFATTDTDQSGITTDEDLDDLIIANLVIPPDRFIKITFSVPVASATGGDRVTVSLKEGTTKIGGDEGDCGVANVPYTMAGWVPLDGHAAGTFTFKLSAGLGGLATGPMTTKHNAGISSFLLIEDIGPASS